MAIFQATVNSKRHWMQKKCWIHALQEHRCNGFISLNFPGVVLHKSRAYPCMQSWLANIIDVHLCNSSAHVPSIIVWHLFTRKDFHLFSFRHTWESILNLRFRCEWKFYWNLNRPKRMASNPMYAKSSTFYSFPNITLRSLFPPKWSHFINNGAIIPHMLRRIFS